MFKNFQFLEHFYSFTYHGTEDDSLNYIKADCMIKDSLSV